jgi:hypothetical protein
MHAVVETDSFRRAANAAGVTEAERLTIIDLVAADPTAGDLMEGIGGARGNCVSLPKARVRAADTGSLRFLPHRISPFSCWIFLQRAKK